MTRSHTADTNHDRLAVQSKQELLSSDDPSGVFLQCDTNSQCHLPFSKIRTSRSASCLCVVFRWASQPRPSITQAFAAMPLADCCLQPNPAVWRNVKYSLLNCQAGAGLEPCQACTVDSTISPPTPPNFKRNPIKSTIFLPANPVSEKPTSSLCHTPTSCNSQTPVGYLINPLVLLHLT